MIMGDEPRDTATSWPTWWAARSGSLNKNACLDCGAIAGTDCEDQCPSAIEAELLAEADADWPDDQAGAA